jgi:hypothetical protein
LCRLAALDGAMPRRDLRPCLAPSIAPSRRSVILKRVLSDDVQRIAAAAEQFAEAGEHVEAVLAAEAAAGERTYLVAFASNGAGRTWLALDAAGGPVTNRDRLRSAVSITAMCEVAEEAVPEPTVGAPPRLASPQYLDTLGAAAGPELGAAIQGALGAVEELAKDVEANYKLELT